MKSILDIKTYSVIYVDGMNFCSVYYHAVPNTYKGHKTGMLTGATRLFIKSHREYQDASIVFLWEGDTSIRRSISSTYKSSRKDWREDTEFLESLDYLRDKVLEHMGVEQRWCDGLEADDLAARYSNQSSEDCYTLLVSGDQDWCAYTNKYTDIMIKNKIITYEDLEQKFGFEPNRLPLYKILTGDASDDIKGVYRFPRKLAVELVKATRSYKKCEHILLNWGEKKWAEALRDNGLQLETNASLIYSLPARDSDIVTLPGIYSIDALVKVLRRRGMETAISDILNWS